MIQAGQIVPITESQKTAIAQYLNNLNQLERAKSIKIAKVRLGVHPYSPKEIISEAVLMKSGTIDYIPQVEIYGWLPNGEKEDKTKIMSNNEIISYLTLLFPVKMSDHEIVVL